MRQALLRSVVVGWSMISMIGNDTVCAHPLIPRLVDAFPSTVSLGAGEPASSVATPASPHRCGSHHAAAPTILLLLPWRVRVDEERLQRKLLRSQERLLAAERDLPRIEIVRSGALLPYHRADAVLKVLFERAAGGENAQLSYVLESRPTELGKRIPWATGAVAVSTSPFRQTGAADAAWGRGSGETAFDTLGASADAVRTAVLRVQYSRPEDDAQAEAIEDAVVRVVSEATSV